MFGEGFAWFGFGADGSLAIVRYVVKLIFVLETYHDAEAEVEAVVGQFIFFFCRYQQIIRLQILINLERSSCLPRLHPPQRQKMFKSDPTSPPPDRKITVFLGPF